MSVRRNGTGVTVLVLVDGDPVSYAAHGTDGGALEREFHAMLSAARPTTGVGP